MSNCLLCTLYKYKCDKPILESNEKQEKTSTIKQLLHPLQRIIDLILTVVI